MGLVLEADYRILYRISCQTDLPMYELALHYLILLTKNRESHKGAFLHVSPTLFNIKINNIVKCVNDTDSSMYVDDFGIFCESKNMENIEF